MSLPPVDLRSDAVTLPSAAMRQAMAVAEVGDDDFGEDPTINRLEARVAEILNKEAALFVHSGTMGNLLSILALAPSGGAVAAGLHSHIFDHEYPGVQSFCGVTLRPVKETLERGLLTWDVDALKMMLIEPEQSRPVLLCLEQTVNRLGGVVLPVEHMAELYSLAHERGLNVHLDGARLFNAAFALNVPVDTLTQYADTVMTVFTKCLGAPGGAILAGPKVTIDVARRQRHYLGGGMKQGGMVAAACLVALEQAQAIPDDHRRARELAQGIAALPEYSVQAENVVSNIVLVDLRPLGIDHPTALIKLKNRGVLATRAMPGILRLVVHRNVDDDGIQQAIAAFKDMAAESCDL